MNKLLQPENLDVQNYMYRWFNLTCNCRNHLLLKMNIMESGWEFTGKDFGDLSLYKINRQRCIQNMQDPYHKLAARPYGVGF